MKLGFFGGCFNPPTNVHIDIAKQLVESEIVDKVIFIPIGDFYKKRDLISIEKRCKMLELAIENQKNLIIDDFEKNIKETIFAKDAFQVIVQKYSKNNDLYFIMGSDNFAKIDNWKEYKQIINLYKYIVIQRKNIEITTKEENILIFNSRKQYNFDSTKVRNLIKEKGNIKNLVHPRVKNYIEQNKLYI